MPQCRTILLLTALAAPVPAAADQAYQDLDALRVTAEQFMKSQPRDAGISVEVQAGALDPRLLLSPCDQDLQAFLPAGGRTVGNATVGVRCSGTAGWSVYVPLRVAAYAEVILAARPVMRGTTLSTTDLRTERRDLATLPYGYLLKPEHATGKRLLRSVNAGAVLAPNLLAAPQWIKRGERVTMVAQSGGMAVRMTGQALTDGTEGEVIRVRNLDSQRVIEGTVIAQGVIQVRL